MSAQAMSRRTKIFGTAGALAIILIAATVAVLLNAGEDFAAAAVSDFGGVIVVGAVAAMILNTAFSLRPGEPLRLKWILIGIGVSLYTLGDVVWTYIEIIQKGEIPFPGPPDVFYVLEYVFVAGGIILAAAAYRKLVDVKLPLAYAAVVTIAIAVVLYVVLLGEMFGDPEWAGLEKALGLFYPIGDVFLELAPAAFTLFVLRKLGGGKLAVPWRWVAGGLVVLAAADSWFTWLDWNGYYMSGHVVDYGWMLGYLLIGMGAMAVRDLAAPKKAASAAE